MQPGDAIGDWVVLKTLGRGGMGTVFLCHHRSDPDDLAALKIFPAWSTDQDGFKRFEREIDVLTRLRHPGIVPLKRNRTAQGRDMASGVYWIAMEVVDGPSLETRLDAGPLPQGYAASQFRRLADALSYAHDQGVFHRDIKPANIVLGREGVRLVDFGIALQRERTRLTAVGTFAGTLAYMAPEVVVDERVHPNPMMGDIYALGVVLYEALTAKRAFATERGLSDRARQMRILKAKMRAAALDPGDSVHDALRKVVVESTEPDPAVRLSHWGRFIELLESVAPEPDVGADDGDTDAHDFGDKHDSTGNRRRVVRPARGRLVRPRRVAPVRPMPGPLASIPEAEPPSAPPVAEAAWSESDAGDSDFTDTRAVVSKAAPMPPAFDEPESDEATHPASKSLVADMFARREEPPRAPVHEPPPPNPALTSSIANAPPLPNMSRPEPESPRLPPPPPKPVAAPPRAVAPPPKPVAAPPRAVPPPPKPVAAPPKPVAAPPRPPIAPPPKPVVAAPPKPPVAPPKPVAPPPKPVVAAPPKPPVAAPPKPVVAPPKPVVAPPKPVIAPPPAAATPKIAPPQLPPAPPVGRPGTQGRSSPPPGPKPAPPVPPRPGGQPRAVVPPGQFAPPARPQGIAAPPPQTPPPVARPPVARAVPPPQPRPQPIVEEEEEEDDRSGVLLLLLAVAMLAFVVVGGGLGYYFLVGPGAGDTATDVEPTALAVDDPGTAEDVSLSDVVIEWKDTGLKQPALEWPESAEPAANVGAGGGSRPSSRDDSPSKTIKKRVKFTSTKESATVFLNGRRRGQTPLTLVLPVGKYELRFVGPQQTVTQGYTIGKFSPDEYQFNEGLREIKPRFN